MQIAEKIILMNLCIIINFTGAFCQKTQPNMQLHLISSEQGLSENVNAFVYKDKMGFIWLSSIDGLNVFDGKKIRVFKPDPLDTFSISEPNIQSSFFETDNGNVWFTTFENLNCYNRLQDKIYRYKFSTSNSYHAFFLEKQRFLWLRIESDIFRFDTYQPGNKIQKIATVNALRFAVDTTDDGSVNKICALFFFYKGFEILDFNKNYKLVKQESFFSKPGILKFPELKARQAIFENDSTLWIATNLGLMKFNPEKPEKFEKNRINNFINDASSQIISIASRDKESIWVTSRNKPLLIFDKKSRTYQTMVSTTFLDWESGADALLLDNSKNLWISAYYKGVAFCSTKKQGFYQPVSDSTVKKVREIIEDKTGYWIRTDKNLVHASATRLENLQFRNRILILKNRQKWAISGNTISQFDDKKNTFLPIASQPDLGIGIEFGDFQNINNTTIAISNGKNLFTYDINKKAFNKIIFKNSNDKIDNSQEIYNFYFENQDKIWFKSGGENLTVGNLSNTGCITKLKEFPTISGITTFFESKADTNIMWVGTAKGLLKINKQTYTDTLITEKDGLPNQYIQSILEDKKGFLWCSTNKGIFRYHPVLKNIKHYTKSNGLINSEYNPGSALYTKKGEMWFGGPNGIDAFVPEEITDIGEAPQLAITGLKIHDKVWRGDTNIVMKQQIVLPYDQNTLTFDLAAMEYTDPEKNKFMVMLGKDNLFDTIRLGTQNFVTYANLTPGEYIFKFTACNSEGIWNETPRVLKIQIVPPFWRRWWFQVSVALAALTLVGYIVWLRLSKVIELQRVRLKLYENLHDDIGSRLTAIVLSVDELMQRQKQHEPKLLLIGNISKNIINNMRRLVWATAPENDALNNVVEKMQADRRLLLPPEIIFTTDASPTIQKLEISGDKRYQMLSVFNESLSNITKYAEAKKVSVHLSRQADNLVMEIIDDGIGFEKEQPRADKPNSSGYGLMNMQRRANRIKGTLNITSKLGVGTCVKLIFPIYDESFLERIKSVFNRK